jgi:FkbM family methyltransferase
LLKRNTSYYDNIFIEQKGIWNRECNLEIFEGPDKKPWSFYLKPTEKPVGENIIEAIGIRELMEKYNLEYIDLLKIDIEGAEQELFESNYEDWLPKVKVMIIELHDRFKPLSSKNFLKVICQYNFNIYFKGENIIATQVFK